MRVWLCFLTAVSEERQALEWFTAQGVEAWYPTVTKWRHRPRAKIKRVEQEYPAITRYIFASYTDGEADFSALRACKHLRGVVGIAGTPVAISDAEIGRMKQLPARLAAMQQAEADRLRINPGDKAQIIGGAMDGWVVDVADVSNGLARFIVPLLGERLTDMPVERLAKVAHG